MQTDDITTANVKISRNITINIVVEQSSLLIDLELTVEVNHIIREWKNLLNMTNNILEISLVGENQQFKLNGLQWEDPAAWGLLLADLAKFIASTYQAELAIDQNVALKRIIEGLQIELSETDSTDA